MAYIKEIIKSGWNASLGQPRKIGEYEQELDVRTNRRTIKLNSVEPLYFHKPKNGVVFDLLAGYNSEVTWIRDRNPGVYEDDEDRSRNEPSNQIFKWILANPDALVDRNGLPIDFIATRSKLTNLLLVPNLNPTSRKHWPILASKFRGTIFLKIKNDNEWVMIEPDRADVNNKLSYSGNQFQRYLLSSQQESRPGPAIGDQDLTKLKSYKGIIRSSVRNRKHLYSFILPRDLDGADPHFEGPEESMERFVEIKSTDTYKKHKPNFERFDLQKWWAAAHLVGVPKIICGYRNEYFKVFEMETFFTEDIPRRCDKFWSKDRNISFFDGFLSLVKNRVVENNPRIVYEFKYNPVSKFIKSERLDATPEMQVVPEWFIKEFEALG